MINATFLTLHVADFRLTVRPLLVNVFFIRRKKLLPVDGLFLFAPVQTSRKSSVEPDCGIKFYKIAKNVKNEIVKKKRKSNNTLNQCDKINLVIISPCTDFC